MLFEVTISSTLSLFYHNILFSKDAPTTTEIEVPAPETFDSAIASEEEAERQEMQNWNHQDLRKRIWLRGVFQYKEMKQSLSK